MKKFPIYSKYLKIRFSNPISIFLAFFTPFSQATLGSLITVYIANNQPMLMGISSLFYWLMYALNAKRVALGKWKAILSFTIFATLGTIFGYFLGINL